MDATGLWFSRLERNFSADYGQFRWTEEQRTWDWDKLKTVDLVRTKDGTKRLVLRRQAAIHTRHGRPDLPKKDGSSDASLRYMLGIDINDEPKDIECDYYTARVYDHYKNVWNMEGPKKRSSFQISENAWLWQWAEKSESKGVSKEVDIKEIHKYIKEEFNKKIVYINVFNLDVGPHDKFKPVI